ncbi:unnamed protein product [Tuber aestivum]|uniref:Uncharacterized protein n=1 Tax=Tuber aestivum TaxID=59557 RepID=A0A292PPW9_9PEZI|nr:unnamed protein product [Tuber aestivum]
MSGRMGLVEDKLRKNHVLVRRWREKARKLVQIQELYHERKRQTLISQVQQAAAVQADQALYVASGKSPDARQLQDPRARLRETIHPRIRPGLGPEYTITGAKIGSIQGLNATGPGGRGSESLRRPGQRPANGASILFNDKIPFLSTLEHPIHSYTILRYTGRVL